MKIYLSGANVIIDDGVAIPAVVPSLATDYDVVGPAGQETVVLMDKNTETAYTALATAIQDQSGALVGDLAAVQAYLDAFIGSANTGGTTPTGGGVDSWIYKNSVYTLAGSSLDLKAVTLPFTVSDSVTLESATTADSVHDGTNFKFTEGDIIDMKFNFFMELNVTSNMVLAQMVEGANIVAEGNADTNKQLDAGHCICFRDVEITAAMATNGLDVKFYDVASGGTYIDVYELFFSITKKGEAV